MKQVLEIRSSPAPHWVGNAFHVRTLLSYDRQPELSSPFLLLDYGAPKHFEPAAQPRGVGSHPHRGFETVTIVYAGEVEHRDSTGAGGKIGPGDVQWMTAGAGLVHQEYQSSAFTASGGTMEMVQLWVNLPAKDKMTPPAYQTLPSQQIPVVALPDNGGVLRVIAGQYLEHAGRARTFTPMDVWDLMLRRDEKISLPVKPGRSVSLMILAGTVQINDKHLAREGQLVLLGRDGDSLTLEASGEAKLLLLSGEPIDEPVVGHGPFVMNTHEEISQAIHDFNNGLFGSIPAKERLA